MTATANYRADLKNINYQGDLCASQFVGGIPAPTGCVLPSFTTVDLSARYNLSKHLQLFGSITNLFDKVARLDPLTYGGMSYNPMNASGAIGHYFKIGGRYQF